MNEDVLKGEWKELKGKIKAKWGQLTDDDVAELEGNMDKVAGHLQQRYGYAKERAEKEYDDFKKSLAAKVLAVTSPKRDV